MSDLTVVGAVPVNAITGTSGNSVFNSDKALYAGLLQKKILRKYKKNQLLNY
jgi:hypothetical protein